VTKSVKTVCFVCFFCFFFFVVGHTPILIMDGEIIFKNISRAPEDDVPRVAAGSALFYNAGVVFGNFSRRTF